MGLFSSVLHLDGVPRDRVLAALDRALEQRGFARAALEPVPKGGPLSAHEDQLQYIIAPDHGRWAAVIEVHFAVDGAPHLADLGCDMSGVLQTSALTLVVHDDDLFFYNLDRNGESLDGYSSCPQYFENDRIPETVVAEQRHHPEPFASILPEGVTLASLEELLEQGWWRAHDTGRLDQGGVEIDDPAFVFEGERMIAFGNLLGLGGFGEHYPYAAWADEPSIPWEQFVAVRYSKA